MSPYEECTEYQALRAELADAIDAVDLKDKELICERGITRALRAELAATRDELENTRSRETKLQTDISEIGARSHVLERKRNELHIKLEQEMLEADALRAELAAIREAIEHAVPGFDLYQRVHAESDHGVPWEKIDNGLGPEAAGMVYEIWLAYMQQTLINSLRNIVNCTHRRSGEGH